MNKELYCLLLKKFLQKTQNNIEWSMNLGVANSMSGTSTSDDACPNMNHSTSMHCRVVSDASCSQDFDPFEVDFCAIMKVSLKIRVFITSWSNFCKYCFQISKTVKDIASKGGYSQLFKDHSTSAKAVCLYSLL